MSTESIKGYVSSPAPAFDYDMNNAPIGAKVILLNYGGCACMGQVTEATRTHYAAWAPLPKRDKELERRKGIRL